MPQKLKNLINQIEIIDSSNLNNEIDIHGISDDSREIKDNFIFVAVRGSVSNGNDYIEKLSSCNSILIITDDKQVFDLHKSKVNIALVENSRLTLSKLLNFYFDFPSRNIKTIGITGTNGKTTVSTLLFQSLRLLNKNVALIGTNGIWINDEKKEATHTTPSVKELILLFKEFKAIGIEYVIMEVSSHSLDQHRVEFIDFDIAIFTNLTRDHLDYHITMENYAKAKKMLFDKLSINSLAILDSDDKWAEFMLSDCKAEIRKLSFAKKVDNYAIKIINSGIEGNKFEIENGSDVILIDSPLLSNFNIMNLSFVALSLDFLGFRSEVSDLLSKVKGPEGRMEKVNLKNGAIAVVDYAHTPDALEKALKSLKELTSKRVISVFGCGGDRDKGKRKLMGNISNQIANLSIVTSDNPRTENPKAIIDDIIVEMKGNFEIIVDRKAAIKKAVLLSESGDIILIAGKGHEKYQVVGTEKVFFDDFDEIKKANLEL